ncbi:helix-turn-helix domain-containing protein [Cereibacter johrii]|uniref:helix-turn-helix domain-containing protein n=1 Tax=Cereibacter johrii TaxID=445629 RepID=UPI000DCAE852|nr:helix-turn-helix transcriptional regulator [Cereibacter johrii]RAZ86505.1 hypothetical protein DDV93_08890 [Cereibacter johrii]
MERDADLPPGGGGRVRTHAPLTRDQFGRHLSGLMLARGWRQADLAKAAGLSRDRVSCYVRGTAYPDEVNLQKLSQALGVDLEAFRGPAPPRTGADEFCNLRVSRENPGRAWLRIDREVTTATALEILRLLTDDPTENVASDERAPRVR